MPHDNRPIIADTTGLLRRVLVGTFVTAAAIGSAAAAYYAWAGLTLSHYDARAHLVVARRIADSLTPGWQQIGAVWLPLPHILLMPLVYPDWAYRTGYPAVALSVLALACGLSALGALVLRRTGSLAAAVAGPLVILLNPNVLYLQSTPMTEPLLIGLSLLGVGLVARWVERGEKADGRLAGLVIMALALTRYEGWLISGALVALGAVGRWRSGLRHGLSLAPYLVGAIAGFLVLGKATTGAWFVTSGFFDPDPSSLHAIGPAVERVIDGTQRLGGTVLIIVGLAGLVLALFRLSRGDVATALPIALLAAGALPAYAFYEGHPFRIRYMVPLVVALGALSTIAIAAVPRRYQWSAAAVFVAAVLWQCPPLDSRAPMVVEAQWERPLREGREQVTHYLTAEWNGAPILASMGSLAHYMQEASHAGFVLADFVHEGNGELWRVARQTPARYVEWVLIEEQSEGGDVLAVRARSDPAFLKGLIRVAEGGGTALYRRQ